MRMPFTRCADLVADFIGSFAREYETYFRQVPVVVVSWMAIGGPDRLDLTRSLDESAQALSARELQFVRRDHSREEILHRFDDQVVDRELVLLRLRS